MRFVLALTLALAGVGAAHGDLTAATPAQNETVIEAPAQVTLTFSEPLEVAFSTFKVYPLEAEGDGNPQCLNGLAGALVSDVLEARGDEAARGDTGVSTSERTSETVTLPLKGGLEPGRYVVMWRALSVDTHTTQGFYVFTYAPGP